MFAEAGRRTHSFFLFPVIQFNFNDDRLPRARKGGGFDAAVAQVAAFFQAQTIEKTPPAAAALYATTDAKVRKA